MKGQLTHLAAMLYNSPLMVLPSFATTVAEIAEQRLLGEVDALPINAAAQIERRTKAQMHVARDGILVMPIVGATIHRGDGLDAECGMQSYTHMQNVLRGVMQSEDVRAVLLDIDSPGGMVHGLFEFCDVLAEVSKTKPVRAICNGTTASAAYAIAAVCDHIYAIPSADVGSIGVITMHRDISKMADRQGIKTTLIFAGDHKADGNPFEPLPDNVRAGIQARVDASYDKFVTHIATARGLAEHKVRATKAGMYSADDAKERGLVDDVMSYDAALADFAASLKVQSVPPQRTVIMTTKAEAPQTGAEMQALMDRAYKDGQTAATTAAQADIAAAYARGRAEAAAIVTHAEAGGRAALAAELAGDASFTVDRAASFLAKTPKADEAGGKFSARLVATSPTVASNAPASPEPSQPQGGLMSGVLEQLNAMNAKR